MNQSRRLRLQRPTYGLLPRSSNPFARRPPEMWRMGKLRIVKMASRACRERPRRTRKSGKLQPRDPPCRRRSCPRTPEVQPCPSLTLALRASLPLRSQPRQCQLHLPRADQSLIKSRRLAPVATPFRTGLICLTAPTCLSLTS